MSVESPELTNNLVKEEKRAEQPRSGEASAQPEQAELKIRVIKLKSVLLGNDGINIQYTWVEGGNPNPNVSYTLPLGMVQEMVQRGVCIFSEGFDDSQGSNVEENLVKLREFVKDQEKLRREREREKGLDLLAETASELSFPVSKNPTEVAGVPGVSTGPETDAVAAQTQTDSSEQEPDSGRIEAQQTDSSEQEPDSDSIEARINDILIKIKDLRNEECYLGLGLIKDFLTSGEFESSSVSPEYIKLIANAILTIVNRGILFEGLQFVNNFLMEYPACLDILNKAISMESIQIAEQLKEELKKLFIRIKDEVVKFGDLVSSIQNISIYSSSTPSQIIGQDNLSFLKLIYQKITAASSQVDEIIKEVFATPLYEWIQANITRINEIARPILDEVDERTIAEDLRKLRELRESHYRSSSGLSSEERSKCNSIKTRNQELKNKLSKIVLILDNYNQNLSFINEVSTESNTMLTRVRSLLSNDNLDRIINFKIP